VIDLDHRMNDFEYFLASRLILWRFTDDESTDDERNIMKNRKITDLIIGDLVNKAELGLITGKLSRRRFLNIVATLGVTSAATILMADHGTAVAANQLLLKKNLLKKYDYIVCGSGCAGSVVARRLSDNPNASVLLLEAGGTDNVENVTNPGMWSTNLGSEREWGDFSTPQPNLNNRIIPMAMGKVFGGGSSINVMAYARGHKTDYDFWAQEAGDPTWNYEHVLSIYKRIEDYNGPGDPEYRGKGGIVWSQIADDPNPIAPAMVRAAAGIGIPAYDDHNGVMMERKGGGVGISNHSIKDGRRQNTPSHYLHPVMTRKNLTIITSANVQKLSINANRATAVQVIIDGKQLVIEAGSEIILSAGAVNTPKILMLSGIGDAKHLKEHDITTQQHLPGVGQNFHDHPLLGGCIWEYKTPQLPKNSFAECTFFSRSNSSLASPDLQSYQIEIPFASQATAAQYQLPEHAWSIAPGLVQPKSRGYIKLASNNPADRPIVDPNFLSDEADMTALARCVEMTREVGNAPELQEFVKREVMPGPLTRKELEDFIRNATGTYWHQVGSCRMGQDDMAVVNSSLQVYGIDGLRIADGSIMPRITTGNTAMPCTIIGERLGEILA